MVMNIEYGTWNLELGTWPWNMKLNNLERGTWSMNTDIPMIEYNAVTLLLHNYFLWQLVMTLLHLKYQ